MIQAAVSAIVIFALSFSSLLVVEAVIHKITHNPDKSYKWGVWFFSLLAAVWAFVTNLGR